MYMVYPIYKKEEPFINIGRHNDHVPPPAGGGAETGFLSVEKVELPSCWNEGFEFLPSGRMGPPSWLVL